MPISAEAIKAFLAKEPDWIPTFKGADPKWLTDTIYDLTGHYYQSRKSRLRPHQLEGVAFATYQSRCLLYYSMRTGKSITSLHWAEHLRKAGIWRGKGLIICHAPIALSVWTHEAEKHSNLKVRAVQSQMDDFLDALDSDTDLICIPWSGLQNIFTQMRVNRQGKNQLYPDLETIRIAAEVFSLSIIDEIHAAKNWQSLRFKIAVELIKHCKYRIGLTGTPFGRNQFDVWAQAYLTDEGKTLGYNYKFFEAAFGIPRFNPFTKQTEYIFDKKKQGILERKLASISLPYKLEECQTVLVMPGVVELSLTGDQLIAYNECIDKLVKLDDNQDVEIRNTFIRLRQISSGYLPFVDAFGNTLVQEFTNNTKIAWLKDLLEIEEIPPTLIFHEFTQTGSLICEALTKAKVKHGWLHGATKDKPGVCQDFQDGRVQVIVVQSATGSLAIDLHRADYLLFFESPVSPIIRQQAEARASSAARGERPILIDDLACSGIERKILSYISEGKSLMTALIHERKHLAETKPKRKR